MRLFLKKLLLLAFCTALLCLALSAVPFVRFHFTNGTTESNLLVMPHGEHVGVVLLGTSHGRIFSRAGNHERVERILGESMLNLSKGEGRGIVAEDIFLHYFYAQGNTARDVVYVIDPFVFYADAWNDDNDFLFDEPLDIRFTLFLLQTEHVPMHVWANYLKSKLAWGWVMAHPSFIQDRTDHLSSVDPQAVHARIENLYPEGTNSQTFRTYVRRLDDIVALARAHGSRITFVIPTTLLGEMPGRADLLTELARVREKDGVRFFDYSSAVTNPSLYYDHDHLNTAGVELFAEQYLKPLLK